MHLNLVYFLLPCSLKILSHIYEKCLLLIHNLENLNCFFNVITYNIIVYIEF